MLIRMSTLFLRTLREDPADAEVPRHRLLVRAGYVRRVAPGIFTWLPLGYRVLRNVERIVREEMDAAGFQEVHFPALLPREPYEATNRWTEYGAEPVPPQGPPRHRLPARPHARGDVHAHWSRTCTPRTRTCPLSLYQIQTKYRDEARPRAGILRGREFVMKDSYSFDIDDAGLDASYARTATPTSRPSTASAMRVRDRLGDVRRDGRLGVRGVPRRVPESARTPTSAAPPATTPPTSRP